jgi:acetolactate synthase-1/2/3 large subunit
VSDPAGSTGAQLILDILADEGVDIVFGYPGGAIMPLYDKLYGHSIRHILTRHEQAASFAAGGYARATGRVGVCFATSGPGATNLITGLLDAQMDSVPLVAITGQVRTALMGTDAFQEADVTSIAGPATKRAILIRDVADIEQTLRAAFRLARGPRPGSVLVDVPQDVLKAPCAPFDPAKAVRPTTAHSTRADSDELDKTIELILGAKRPIAIVGGGARIAGATHLFREFCAMLDIPHTATINGLGCAAPGDPRFLGMVGMHGWKAANLAVNDADVILAFGMRFDDRVTGKPDRFARGATIVHADVDESEFGKVIAPAVKLRGDLRYTLAQLVQRLAELPSRPSFAEWADQAKSFGPPPPADRTPDDTLSATSVLDHFFDRVSEDAIVSTDVGQHQMWAAQRHRATHPRNFLTSAGLGAMGFGLPAAIGAQFAFPGRPVAAIVGDGGFQMSFAELATIARYELPVKILLIDNRRLGMVRQWQELFYEKRYSATDLSDNPDFVAIAQAYGIRGELVEDASTLGTAMERFLAQDGPALLHCACYPSENVWPLIPAGTSVTEMLEERPVDEAPATPQMVRS